MTLRVDISIVPYGVEENKYELYRLDVSNTGVVEDLGFGHIVCSYEVKAYKHNNETMQRVCNSPEYELENTVVIERHNRRDGFMELVHKVLDKLNVDRYE